MLSWQFPSTAYALSFSKFITWCRLSENLNFIVAENGVWHWASSCKFCQIMVVYFTDCFVQFLWSFFSSSRWGYGDTETMFSVRGGSSFSFSSFSLGSFPTLCCRMSLNSAGSVEWGNRISLYFPYKIIWVQLGGWGVQESVLSLLSNTVGHAAERWCSVPALAICQSLS